MLIMFIVGSSIIAISPTIEMSKIEKRTLFKREDFKMNTEIDKQVNSILKDQFYSRENLIKIYYILIFLSMFIFQHVLKKL